MKIIPNISQRWRQLSGANNWKNLLNPLDDDLRQYLAHYGSMVQATYDTFNVELSSRYTGCSRYSKRNLFKRVGLVKGNPYKYKVVKYIYATSSVILPQAFMLRSMSPNPCLTNSNWIGYVAAATKQGKKALGRRDILVAWRGTVLPVEWITNIQLPLVPATEILGKGCNNAHVHQGFFSLYTSRDPDSLVGKASARDQVMSEVRRQVEKYKNEEMSITVTGHSLGGALANMNAADIVSNGLNKSVGVHADHDAPCMVTAFKFGSPRVGDCHYKNIVNSLDNLHMLDIQNVADIVPDLPPIPYVNAGVELRVDSLKLDFLKWPGDIDTWHGLEGAYIPSILGRKGTFERGIHLVNKSCGALKDEYMIPVSWWIEKNKGMVQNENGSWELNDHEEDDNDDYPNIEDDDDDNA